MKRKINAIYILIVSIVMIMAGVGVCKNIVYATNTSISNAKQITFGTTYNDSITEDVIRRYYRITVPSSGMLKFDLKATNDALYMFLYDANYEKVYKEYKTKNYTVNMTKMQDEIHLNAGTYYLVIDGSNTSVCVGDYQFNIIFSAAKESFIETQKDNYINGANNIEFNTNYSGHIAFNNEDADYYKFVIQNQDVIQIDAIMDMSGYARIYDEDGKVLWERSILYSSATGKYNLSRIVNIYPGTYYFRVKENSKGGNYSFKISSYNATKKPSRVSISYVKSTKKKTATIKWKKLSDVNGYQIQYSKSKKFKRNSTVTAGKNKTKKMIKKLSSKKKYYIRIRAYKTVAGKNKYGSWSRVKSVKTK